MGIKGLMKLISDNAPAAIKEKEMKHFTGRKVAVDASMSLYQFLIAVRQGADDQALTNEMGEVTSHLQGMFYRTIRIMDNGVKPCFVFDGKPPELKSGELEERKKKREKAEAELKEAKKNDNQEDVNKFQRRLVHVTKEQNKEAMRLLRLMGVPVIEAPGEAEAQAAELVKGGKIWGTATEDMDALTFGTNKLLRHMTFSAARKKPVVEIDLKILLEDMGLTMDQFISVCIMCGCDYTNTVRGIGPVRALSLIRKHGDIETALASLDKKKYPVPDNFLYKEAAVLFKKPLVTPADECELVWKAPDEEGILQFLVKEKGFSLERIQTGIKRLKAAQKKGNQKRLESFFGSATVVRKKKPLGKANTNKKASKKGANSGTKRKTSTKSAAASKPKKAKKKGGYF